MTRTTILTLYLSVRKIDIMMTNQIHIDPKVKDAINAALENNWDEAIKLNEGLIKKYPNDIDTLNRLARSLSETGEFTSAKKLYKKVLGLDPYNPIAEKNLVKLSSAKKADLKENASAPNLKGDLFLEDPGKTVTAALVDTAMPSVLAGLQSGDNISLSLNRNNVTVLTANGKRIGKIESTLAKIIAPDLRSGSKFEALIKSVVLNKNTKKQKPTLTIFIRETHRSSKIQTPPFPSQPSSFTPYVREESLKLLSNQSPVPTEADDSIEEVEISQLPSSEKQASVEDLADKEQEEDENSEEE